MAYQSSADEALVSVDVEASGPSPGTGSLVAIGACLVDEPAQHIYLELKPLPDRAWSAEAERIHGLARAHLEREGLEAGEAMRRFEAWLAGACAGRRPVFVGFNAAFDWMFVADYFERYLGRNPFGPSALDIKSYYMGRHGVPRWSETSRRHVRQRHAVDAEHTHHALDDAREQAALMRLLRNSAD